MAKYYGILSHDGEAAISNAFLTGQTIDITHIAVGDGNGAYYEPTPEMTALKKEVHRMPANTNIDPDYPNIVRINGIIPSDVGGFTVRELAAYDSKGKMVGIANYPDSPKVTLSEGVDAEMSVGFGFAVSHAEVINLAIDPTIIIATKRDIERHNLDEKSHPWLIEQLSNKANVEKPEVTPLLLLNGLSPYSGSVGAYYYKNQFNEVTMTLCTVTKDGGGSDNIPSGIQIALLPEGYRPTILHTFSCATGVGGAGIEKQVGTIIIRPDGGVSLETRNNLSIRVFIASITFIAQ